MTITGPVTQVLHALAHLIVGDLIMMGIGGDGIPAPTYADA